MLLLQLDMTMGLSYYQWYGCRNLSEDFQVISCEGMAMYFFSFSSILLPGMMMYWLIYNDDIMAGALAGRLKHEYEAHAKEEFREL